MKLSTKPISSPGRAEKYPPPLMRFLRSNVGSRSRGRSRSSPMFVRKKNAAIETQEPTSPKVTCMGQVRVKRSKQQPNNRTGTSKTKRRCEWIKNALFCRHFSKKLLKPKCSRPSWRKLVLFFHIGFKRKGKIRQDCQKIEPKFSNRSQELDQESEEDDEEEEKEAKVYVSTTVTPPKNSLLLTRSRSAPYRSSSLASRFWGSPLSSEETEQKQSTEQENTEEEEEDDDDEEDDSPTSKRELLSKESDQEAILHQETEENIGFFKEFEDPITSVKERISRIEEFKTEEGSTVHPLILTRCKSEPARIAEKLDPEISFWKKRRLGFS